MSVETLKKTIVAKIENGELTAASAGHKYGVKESTIRSWMKRKRDKEGYKKVTFEAFEGVEVLKEGEEVEEVDEFPLERGDVGDAAALVEEVERDVESREVAEVEEVGNGTVNLVERVRGLALEGIATSASAIDVVREEARGVYEDVTESIVDIISGLKEDLKRGYTIKHRTTNGIILQSEVKLSIKDKLDIARTIKELTRELADMGCLVRGAIDSNKFIETKSGNVASQHIHLHAHGSSSHKPVTEFVKVEGGVDVGEGVVREGENTAVDEAVSSLPEWKQKLLS